VRSRRHKVLLVALRRVALASIAAAVLFPLLWTLRTSLAPARDMSLFPSLTFEHYRFLLGQPMFYTYLQNSLYVTVATVLIVLVLALLAGYALAKLRFPGRRLGITFLLVPLIPPLALLVPLISYLFQAGLFNTLNGLVVLNTVFNLPFAIWMARGFVLAVPDEVEEAAMIDGASRIGIVLRIVLPITTTGMVAVGTYVFIQTWNNYIYAFAIISSPSQRVVPMGILASLGAWGTQWGPLTAFGILGVLPPILLLVLGRRAFIAGFVGATGK
jgi:ABC-type glycerol-3-phosphate transport system permease component